LSMLSHLTGRTLVICPHFDDACLSIGGLLLKKTAQEVVILTVFSKSQHAPGFRLSYRFLKTADALNLNLLSKIVVDLISRERQKEDRLFCDTVCADQEVLSFPDSSLRGYVNPYDTCNVEEEPVYRSVLGAIKKAISTDPYDSIFCPLAIGDQVDHLIVMKTFLQLLTKESRSQTEILFYEDLPYASGYSLDSLRSLAWQRTGVNNPSLIDVTAEMPLKQRLVDIYRSQASREMKNSLLYHARRLSMLRDRKNAASGYCERIWRAGMLNR
jgi:LmbE family N-acetylglucosaminyl deacetylase